MIIGVTHEMVIALWLEKYRFHQNEVTNITTKYGRQEYRDENGNLLRISKWFENLDDTERLKLYLELKRVKEWKSE